MKHLISVPIFLALSVPSLAGTESVAPYQPMFVPPVNQPVFVPPILQQGASATATGATSQQQVTATAARISAQIATAQLFCTRVSVAEYRIDCLADQLAQVAATIPADADFNDARQIIKKASTELKQVARKRPSSTRRPARLSSGGSAPISSSRPIVPIEPAELPQANAEAEAILAEAETLLLRASETSERRKVAYEQMAEAVGSTKILLRSS